MRLSFALPIDLSVKSDNIASTKRSAFQGFSNAIKRLFNVEAKASQLPQTFQTTATTSASLNVEFAFAMYVSFGSYRYARE